MSSPPPKTAKGLKRPKLPMTAYNIFLIKEMETHLLGKSIDPTNCSAKDLKDLLKSTRNDKPSNSNSCRKNGQQTMTYGRVKRMLALKWKLLAPIEKQKFEEKARQQRTKFKHEMELFKSGGEGICHTSVYINGGHWIRGEPEQCSASSSDKLEQSQPQRIRKNDGYPNNKNWEHSITTRTALDLSTFSLPSFSTLGFENKPENRPQHVSHVAKELDSECIDFIVSLQNSP